MMKKAITNLENLMQSWDKVYATKQHELNILESIHLSENDHSNILCGILNTVVNGKRIFLQSFVEKVLCISGFANTLRRSNGTCTFEDLIVTTQVGAIGTERLGYIDLLIEDTTNQKAIIIENKICNATDGKWQLQRYWCTYAQHEQKWHQEFINAFDKCNPKKTYKPENVYVVYIANDSDMHPNCKSVQKELFDEWNKRGVYRSISIYDVTEWLEKDVIPNMPYCKHGYPVQSVLLYSDYLRQSFGAENSWSQEMDKIEEIIFNKTKPSTEDRFNTLYDLAQKLTQRIKSEEDKSNTSINFPVAYDLLKYLNWAYRHVFEAPEGWNVIATPSYITTYPTKWLEKYGGTLTSNIHWDITNWRNIKKAKMNFCIHNSACAKYIDTDNNKVAYEIKNIVFPESNVDLGEKIIYHPDGHFRYWNITLKDSIENVTKELKQIPDDYSELINMIENKLK